MLLLSKVLAIRVRHLHGTPAVVLHVTSAGQHIALQVDGADTEMGSLTHLRFCAVHLQCSFAQAKVGC